MAAIVSTTMATTTTTAATRGGDGGEGQTEEGWMRAKRVNERPTRGEEHESPQEWQEEGA